MKKEDDEIYDRNIANDEEVTNMEALVEGFMGMQFAAPMMTKTRAILDNIKHMLAKETGKDYLTIRKSKNGTLIIEDLNIYLGDEDDDVYKSILATLEATLDFSESSNFEKQLSEEMLRLYNVSPDEFYKIIPLDV